MVRAARICFRPKRSALAILTAFPLLVAFAHPPDVVAYDLTPDIVGGKLKSLKVQVHFRMNDSGTARFGWSSAWQGERRLWQWARDVGATGASSFRDDGAGHWTVEAPPAAQVSISYRIVSAYDHDPTINDHDQPRPIIRPRWFYVPGEALFGLLDGSEKTAAQFSWHGPKGYHFASDLEHLARPGRPAGRPGTVADVIESIVIGGPEIQVYRGAGRSKVRVAILGSFGFRGEDFDRVARSVIDVERRFWRADLQAPFLVTVGPLAGSAAQMGFEGTGRGDAFALWVDERSPIDRLKWLLAHEYFHSWNPLLLGRTTDQGEANASLFWFSEGLTDYYARALLVRSGLITPQEFLDQWNEMLRAYSASPAKNMKGADANAAFWSDEAAQKLAYQRGAMLAAIWNAELSTHNLSLDDVMHEQAEAARSSNEDPVALFRRLAEHAGLHVREDTRRYIDDGETIRLSQGAFGPCAAVVTEDRPVFSRGFDGQATANAGNVVTGTDRTSPAYAAGLRDGMTILERVAGEPDNSMAEYALLVDDHGTRRTIRYLPQGSGRTTVQQVKLLEHGASCGKALGGVSH